MSTKDIMAYVILTPFVIVAIGLLVFAWFMSIVAIVRVIGSFGDAVIGFAKSVFAMIGCAK
jgi:hypothetical protein